MYILNMNISRREGSEPHKQSATSLSILYLVQGLRRGNSQINFKNKVAKVASLLGGLGKYFPLEIWIVIQGICLTFVLTSRSFTSPR